MFKVCASSRSIRYVRRSAGPQGPLCPCLPRAIPGVWGRLRPATTDDVETGKVADDETVIETHQENLKEDEQPHPDV